MRRCSRGRDQNALIETDLRNIVDDAFAAALLAGILSGAPSTAISIVRHESLLASTRAAGMLLGRPTLLRGAAAHAGITAGWSLVLSAVLPRRRTVLAGAVAGGVIAAIDLAVVGRRFPAIRALDHGPQLFDHLAFGMVTAAVIAHRRQSPAGVAI